MNRYHKENALRELKANSAMALCFKTLLSKKGLTTVEVDKLVIEIKDGYKTQATIDYRAGDEERTITFAYIVH